MKTQTEQLNPEQDIELTFIPDFQSSVFTVTGAYEAVMPVAEAVQAEAAKPIEPSKPVQAPVTSVQAQNQYIDMSELPSRQIARMKLRSRIYDMVHNTNMTALLIDRINEDRDVAFARGLGILGVTHCAKHEKAVNKLRGML